MTKKYMHIWRTGQNNPSNSLSKKFDVVKRNHIPVILADFSPCGYEFNETRHISTEKLQKQSIHGYVTFGIQLQTFP